MPTDYYELLGVKPNAGEDEIKRAYRKLAREHHPDANAGDAASEARFKEITLAYDTLRDPERRRRYDMFGPEGAAGQAGPAGFDMSSVFGGGIGDLFDAFLGGGGFGGRGTRRAGSQRGPDMEAVVDLEFADAAFGAQRSVELTMPVPCDACEASGATAGTYASSCPECKGTGETHRIRQTLLGQMVTSGVCARCQGTGQVIASPCPACHGEGRVRRTRSWTVDVPAGVDNGTTLRLSGRGAAGPRGGPPGDLYVHLRVRPHERFSRAGDDIAYELHVAMSQAALGTALVVELLDGAEEITIHPGTQTGTTVRMRGRGVPHVRGRGRGDLIIHFVVDTPHVESSIEEDLLRRLAAERGEQVAPPEKGLLARIRSALT